MTSGPDAISQIQTVSDSKALMPKIDTHAARNARDSIPNSMPKRTAGTKGFHAKQKQERVRHG